LKISFVLLKTDNSLYIKNRSLHMNLAAHTQDIFLKENTILQNTILQNKIKLN